MTDSEDQISSPPDQDPTPPKQGNFIVRYWRGEEKLWKAYWLFGFLGSGIFGSALGFGMGMGLFVFLPAIGRSPITLGVNLGMFHFIFTQSFERGLPIFLDLGVLVLAAVYTIWVVVSIWNCAWNVRWEGWGVIARGLVVIGSLVTISNMIQHVQGKF